jgi:hypothetical protein
MSAPQRFKPVHRRYAFSNERYAHRSQNIPSGRISEAHVSADSIGKRKESNNDAARGIAVK